MTDTDTPRTTAPATEGDALTAEQIADIRTLNAQRDSEHPWLMRTAEIRWQLERVARDAIIPALDMIETRDSEIAALRDRLARAEERERAREYENSKQRDMLAEAIIQLGGTLTVMPQILMMRRDWIMTGPERRQPDGAYVWRVHRTTPTDGAAPPRRSGEREGDD
jgi:hypothetical protein